MMLIANVLPKLKIVNILINTLSKKHRFKTSFGSEHVKASQLLAKSTWECIYHVLLSFSRIMIWNMSPLVFGEILGKFVNTLTVDGKYPVEGCENLQLPIQMQLSAKQKAFLNFLFHFRNLHQTLNILK